MYTDTDTDTDTETKTEMKAEETRKKDMLIHNSWTKENQIHRSTYTHPLTAANTECRTEMIYNTFIIYIYIEWMKWWTKNDTDDNNDDDDIFDCEAELKLIYGQKVNG